MNQFAAAPSVISWSHVAVFVAGLVVIVAGMVGASALHLWGGSTALNLLELGAGAMAGPGVFAWGQKARVG